MKRISIISFFILTMLTSCSNKSTDNSMLTANDINDLDHYYYLKKLIGQEIDSTRFIYNYSGMKNGLNILLQNEINKFIVLNKDVCPTCFQEDFKKFIDQNPSFNLTFDIICHFNIAKSIYSICYELNPNINIFLYNESPFDITFMENYTIIIDDKGIILCALPLI